jgi:hypothetical protein
VIDHAAVDHDRRNAEGASAVTRAGIGGCGSPSSRSPDRNRGTDVQNGSYLASLAVILAEPEPCLRAHCTVCANVHLVPKTGYIRWNWLNQTKRLTARMDSKHAGFALTYEKQEGT